jgi:hypothetical protein
MVSKTRMGRLPPARRKRPPRAAAFKRTSRRPKMPPLHIYTVLKWADAHYARTGRWPTPYSGDVYDAPWDSWRSIDGALRHGYRGCRGDSSLVILLHRHRGRPLPLPRPRPRLTIRQILAWADTFHRRTGRWPAQLSRGPVAPGRDETWLALDNALRTGTRGQPGGDSLPRVLMRYRGIRRARYRPRLTIKQILTWADAHHRRSGKWPSFASGPVTGAPGERWASIHGILEKAGRGLPPGYTLATLLAKYRGVPYKKDLPRYAVRTILAWADAYHDRHGRWPSLRSGPIPEAPGETWLKIEGGLSKGRRGLPGGDSLSQLLMRHKRRPYRNTRDRCVRHERLSIDEILAWADEFHRQNERWPAVTSGPIAARPNETWTSVNNALTTGVRGLPGGSSVARLLEERRGARHKHHRPRFTFRAILAWAAAYHAREQRWPASDSGAIPESPGDTWVVVDTALHNGLRGLPGGESLRRLLQRYGRLRIDQPLTISRILAWADQFHRRQGRWPTKVSGLIEGTRDTYWNAVESSLRIGFRGLPGGSSIALLLEQYRGVAHRLHRPRFTTQTILTWADAYHLREGRWPVVLAGPIHESPGDTWNAVENALRNGSRGLPGGDTLMRFLLRHGRRQAATPHASPRRAAARRPRST